MITWFVLAKPRDGKSQEVGGGDWKFWEGSFGSKAPSGDEPKWAKILEEKAA
jgi:hypothetical protein